MQELLTNLQGLKKDLHGKEFDKTLLIKIAVGVAVVLALHGAFWFFKTAGAKKEVEAFLREHQEVVKFSAIKMSGYPFTQKITVENIVFEAPNSKLRYKTNIKAAKLQSSIFTQNFKLTLEDKVNLSNAAESLEVAFQEQPKITLGFKNGSLRNFLYEDKGYSVLNNDKQSVYSAKESKFHFQSIHEKNGAIKNKIDIAISDLDGFGILDIYIGLEENAAIGDNSDINFSLKASYDLTPIENPAEVKFTKNLQIEDLSFSSAFYDFNLSGKLATFANDNIPSGLLLVKVSNAVNFLNHVAAETKKIDERKYQNIVVLLKEVAAKNDVSNDNYMEFKIQRERNLEFLINEVPLKYILQNLGK